MEKRLVVGWKGGWQKNGWRYGGRVVGGKLSALACPTEVSQAGIYVIKRDGLNRDFQDLKD